MNRTTMRASLWRKVYHAKRAWLGHISSAAAGSRGQFLRLDLCQHDRRADYRPAPGKRDAALGRFLSRLDTNESKL